MMQTLHYPAVDGERAPNLVALLAPAEAGADDLVMQGFVASLRQRNLPVDLALPDVEFAHVNDGTALPWLHEQVVTPARQAGYATLWLAGISIGGYLAMSYDDRYPGNVDGLCLLAPYPGSRPMWGEVVRAGGVTQWQAGNVDEADHERRVWRWLQRGPARDIQLHLGIAAEDRFADGQAVLATACCADDVDRVPGGHDWAAWRVLWQRFLERRFGEGGGR